MTKQLRVALVHDYFVAYGGAERVVETLHEMFPEAPVFTALIDKQAMGTQWDRFKNWDIRESWEKDIPFSHVLLSPLRVFSHKFFQSFDLSTYDVVISSTNMYMAKAVRTKPGTLHLCYCHTPPRSLYGYSTMMDWKKHPIIRLGGEIINHFLRIIDYETAQNPNIFIANSKEVQKRIKKFYRRDSTVIYPPIEIPAALPIADKGDFYLYVGRLGYSKHVDLVVEACTQMNKPLYVVGSGKLMPRLQEMAGPTVKFLGSISDTALHELYARAKLVIYPTEDEDFGMIPVEAMAHGTPVVVHRSGGCLESVIEGKTGIFIDIFTVEAMEQAIRKADKMVWNRKAIYQHAARFSKKRFIQEIQNIIAEYFSTQKTATV